MSRSLSGGRREPVQDRVALERKPRGALVAEQRTGIGEDSAPQAQFTWQAGLTRRLFLTLL